MYTRRCKDSDEAAVSKEIKARVNEMTKPD
jgi:hypothetical protein